MPIILAREPSTGAVQLPGVPAASMRAWHAVAVTGSSGACCDEYSMCSRRLIVTAFGMFGRASGSVTLSSAKDQVWTGGACEAPLRMGLPVCWRLPTGQRLATAADGNGRDHSPVIASAHTCWVKRTGNASQRLTCLAERWCAREGTSSVGLPESKSRARRGERPKSARPCPGRTQTEIARLLVSPGNCYASQEEFMEEQEGGQMIGRVLSVVLLLAATGACAAAAQDSLDKQSPISVGAVLSLKGLMNFAGEEYAAVEVGGLTLLWHHLPWLDVGIGCSLDRSQGVLDQGLRISEISATWCFVPGLTEVQTSSVSSTQKDRGPVAMLYIGLLVEIYQYRSGFRWHEACVVGEHLGLRAPLSFLLQNLWADVGVVGGYSFESRSYSFGLELGVSLVVPAW